MGFIDILFGKRKSEEKPVNSAVKFLEDEKGAKSVQTLPITVTPPKQHYIIRSEGNYYIYDSLADMDESMRKQIESIEKIDEMKSIYTVFMDGKRTVYSHFNDIPADIREAITKKK